MKNIALIGFMGTGKSSVGKILAKKTGRKLVDIDRVVEEKEKKKIREIFLEGGEARFRALEKAAILEAAAGQAQVITTGGGAVIDPENLKVLRANALVIALTATPETVYDRVKNAANRPLLQVEDKLGEIKRLMDIRKPSYEQADYRFETDGRNAGQVANLILRKLKGSL